MAHVPITEFHGIFSAVDEVVFFFLISASATDMHMI